MYLSKENLTCPKHKQLCSALTVLIPNVNYFENSMKPDTCIHSIVNSVDPDPLASKEIS